MKTHHQKRFLPKTFRECLLHWQPQAEACDIKYLTENIQRNVSGGGSSSMKCINVLNQSH